MIDSLLKCNFNILYYLNFYSDFYSVCVEKVNTDGRGKKIQSGFFGGWTSAIYRGERLPPLIEATVLQALLAENRIPLILSGKRKIFVVNLCVNVMF